MGDGFSATRRGGWLDVWRLAIPIMISSIAGVANHLAGRYFLGQANDTAIEAILPAGMLAIIMSATLSAFVGYSATFVAQYHGSNDGRSAVASFMQGIYLALFATPLFFLAIPAGYYFLDVAGHAPEILAAEKSYYALAQPAGVLTMLTAVLSGLFTGQGKTRFVSTAAAFGSVLNIVLDRVLVLGLGPIPAMGIRGASISLVIASAAPVVLLVAGTFKDRLFREHLSDGALAIDRRLMARILAFGTPAGASALVGTVCFTVFVLALGRVDAVSLAASNTVFAINNVFYLFICAISGAVTILTGRYRGANDESAVWRSARSGLGIVFTAMAIYTAVLLPFSDYWAGFFSAKMQDQGEFLSISRMLFMIIAVRNICEGTMCVTEGALRGVGDTLMALVINGGGTLFLWMPIVVVLSKNNASLLSLWISSPICYGLVTALLVLRWRCGRWRRINILLKEKPAGRL